MSDLVGSVVRSVVRDTARSVLGIGAGGGGAPIVSSTPTFSSLTTQATNTPTDNTTNVYSVPSWANAVAVYVDRLPVARYRMDVYINNGSTTKLYECYSYQRHIIPATGGSTLYFGAHERVGTTYTTSGVAASITVAPISMPASLSAPSGTTGTANVDRSAPPFWSPTAAHITLADYGQEFQIDAASGYRHFFMKEKDGSGTWGPVRHIPCNDSEATIVRCVGKEIALMSINETSAAITAPSGATIGGTSVMYRPSYTVTGTSRSVSASSDGFGGDQGTAGENLAYCLKNITSGDEIVLAAGTYDLSGAGNPINPTNYATAMARNCRIRGATGTATDVTITGAAVWVFQQNTTTRWIFESLVLGVSGYTPHSAGRAVVDLNMNTSLYNVGVVGPGAVVGTPGSEYPLIEWRGNSTVATTPVAAWCTFIDSLDDLVEVNTHANLTLSLIGCTYDSNGANAISNNYQLLTGHDGTTTEDWGGTFTDATQTANAVQIWPDTTSKIHLLYSRARSTDLTNTTGITLTLINVMYFCNWEKVRAFNLGNRSSVWVGNRFTKDTTSTTACMLSVVADTAVDFSLLAGNYMKASNTSTSNANGLDLRRTYEGIANIVECVAASSSVPLRIAPSSGPSSALANVRMTNSRFIAANALFEISTNANLGVDLINNLFTGSATNMAVGATGASCLGRENYAERSGAPTNWTTRFTTDSNNTFSTTDVTYNAAGAASNAGDGYSSLARYGGIDAKGRALWLGIPVIRGPVENPVYKTTIEVYPDLR